MNKPNKNKYTDTENRVVVIKGEGVGGSQMGTGAQLYCDRWELWTVGLLDNSLVSLLRDSSSPTRDWTPAGCSERAESSTLAHQETPEA